MGVPSLFKTIVNKFPSTHYWKDALPVERFYLDFNCLIHHCKANMKPTNTRNMSSREMDEELISDVIRYTVQIVTEIVKPSYVVYIAIDGPVPYAKMVRQRERRYKKIQDDMYISRLAQKHGIVKEKSFDSNKITPGTSFMSKLCARLKTYIGIGAFSKHVSGTPFRVVLSDSSIPGEGEAKIMKHIKDSGPKRSPKSTVIYGLDGDLIILSMLLDRPDVKLLRESEHIPELEEQHVFTYLDIDVCKESLIREYQLESFNSKNIIQDFCALSMLGGNDFVEPLINTRIRERGLQRLIGAYKCVLHKQRKHLVNNEKINYDILNNIITILGEKVESFVKHRSAESRARILSNEDIGSYEYELSAYFHTPYISDKNPCHVQYVNAFSNIDYLQKYEKWGKEYYDHFFPYLSFSDLPDVCCEYFKSIEWTWLYYTTSEVPSWLYHYKHRMAPLPKDLVEIKCPEFVFENDIPMTPLQQLMIVLPPQNASMLPKMIADIVYDDKSLVSHMYPRKFELDVLKGGKNIYSDPILPTMDLMLIETILRHIPITEYEANRNVIRTQEYSRKF